jgi:hypothetical protein
VFAPVADESTRRGQDDDDFVPIDWYDDEDLDDAIWDVVMAHPADAYAETCQAVLAIVVAQPEWRDRVRAAFADFDALSAALLERETEIARADDGSTA